MTPDDLGNYAYGYVGASLFPDIVLWGDYAHMSNVNSQYIFALPFLPYYGDLEEDHLMIEKGIEGYDGGHQECLE